MEWTGDEKAEKPHSFTTIAKGTSLTGEHGEVSSVEKNAGTSNMQLIAIVFIYFSDCIFGRYVCFMVRRKNKYYYRRRPTISRLLLMY